MRTSIVNAINATLFDVIGDNSNAFNLYTNDIELSPSKFKTSITEGVFPDKYDVLGNGSSKLIRLIYKNLDICIINGYDCVLIDRNIVDRILSNKAVTRYRKFIQTHCDRKKQQIFLSNFKNSDKSALYTIPIAANGVKVNNQGNTVNSKTYHNDKLVHTSIVYLIRVYLKLLHAFDKHKCEDFCSKINIIIDDSLNPHNHYFVDIDGDVISHLDVFKDMTCFQIHKPLKTYNKAILNSDEDVIQISLNILISKLIISGVTNIKTKNHTHIVCDIDNFINILNGDYNNIITFEHFGKLTYVILLTLSRIYVKITYSILKYEWCTLHKQYEKLKDNLVSNPRFKLSKSLLMKISVFHENDINNVDLSMWKSDTLSTAQDAMVNDELFDYLGLNPTKLKILLDYGLNEMHKHFKKLIHKQIELKKCSTSLCNLITFNNSVFKG